MEFVLEMLIILLLVNFCDKDSPQEIIDRYKDKPLCVEQKVGKDTIKRCYVLKEKE